MKILVTGAGGMIGGHLTRLLTNVHGANSVRAVDKKPLVDWYQRQSMAENITGDLRHIHVCKNLMNGITHVYNLAADMGGIGYIENNRADCMLSVLINTNLLQVASDADVERYFFSSSACVYAADKQDDPNNPALKESDAFPSSPEIGYGEEKLFSERMCQLFREDYGFQTRVARYHNVYGPYGTYDGGREKAPAAICRKVIEAKLSGNHTIDIWGDGEQTRSFMWIDDCVQGTLRIMESDVLEPLNLGSSELVTINQLVDIAEELADIKLERTYDLSAPQGVRGRNSDNTLIKEYLSWEPSTPLREGMAKTFQWIQDQMTKAT